MKIRFNVTHENSKGTGFSHPENHSRNAMDTLLRIMIIIIHYIYY